MRDPRPADRGLSARHVRTSEDDAQSARGHGAHASASPSDTTPFLGASARARPGRGHQETPQAQLHHSTGKPLVQPPARRRVGAISWPPRRSSTPRIAPRATTCGTPSASGPGAWCFPSSPSWSRSWWALSRPVCSPWRSSPACCSCTWRTTACEPTRCRIWTSEHSFSDYQLNRWITCAIMVAVGFAYCSIRGYASDMFTISRGRVHVQDGRRTGRRVRRPPAAGGQAVPRRHFAGVPLDRGARGVLARPARHAQSRRSLHRHGRGGNRHVRGAHLPACAVRNAEISPREPLERDHAV